MGIIKGVIKEEYDRLKALILEYKREIKKYPKGSISIKQRRGKSYAYLSYWDKGKVLSKYLGKPSSNKFKKAEKQIKVRRKYESLLREAKQYFKEVSRVTHGRRI